MPGRTWGKGASSRTTARLTLTPRHTLEALGIEDCVRVSAAYDDTRSEVEAFLAALRQAVK